MITGAGQKPLSEPPYMQRMMNHLLIKQVKLLVARLERLSADSLWAHRSSGAAWRACCAGWRAWKQPDHPMRSTTKSGPGWKP